LEIEGDPGQPEAQHLGHRVAQPHDAAGDRGGHAEEAEGDGVALDERLAGVLGPEVGEGAQGQAGQHQHESDPQPQVVAAR
jgi:hypothetical protein